MNENLDKGMDLEDAVAAAVKRAKREDIDENIDVETIAKVSGLSKEKIETL